MFIDHNCRYGGCLRHANIRLLFRNALTIFLYLFLPLIVIAAEFKVQRGRSVLNQNRLTLQAPNDFVAVSNLSNAFVRITNSQHVGAGRTSWGGDQNADDVTTNIRFDGPTQISIMRFGNSDDTLVCWEIVEYVGAPGGANEFIVRDQGLRTFSTHNLSETVSFGGASGTSRLVGFVTGVANPDTGKDDYESGLVTTSFDNQSTLRFTRGSYGFDGIKVSYAVVEFTGANWSVQRVEHTYSNDGTEETESIAAVDLSNSFIHAQKRNDSDLKSVEDFGHQVWLSSSSQVSFKLNSKASTPSGQTSVAWVITNPYMRVYRNQGTLSWAWDDPMTTTLTIDPVDDLAQASVFINNDCWGHKGSFPCPILGARLTAADTVELWRSDSGGVLDFRLEVVQWPDIPAPSFKITGTVYQDESKTTTLGAGKAVALSVNGAAPLNAVTDGDGKFAFAENVSNSDVLLLYLNPPSSEIEAFHAPYYSSSGTNITEGNGSYDLYETNLVNNENGTDSGMNIAIDWLSSNLNDRTIHGNKNPIYGTDAYALFNGKIFLGNDWTFYNGSTGDDFLRLTFSGLDPAKKYTLAFYSSAGSFAQYSTLYTLGGAAAATQASSSGVTIVSNEAAALSFFNTDYGRVVRWTDVSPTGTSLTVTCSARAEGYGMGPQAIYIQENSTGSDKGSLVTVTDGVTSLTGADAVDLVRGDVILQHQSGTSITNAQLDVIDDVAPNNLDGIAIASGAAIFAPDMRLWISSGKHYVPGGNVTLGSLRNSGSMTLTDQIVDVSGDWWNEGSITAGTSTVQFSGTNGGMLKGDTAFYNFQCATENKALTFTAGSTQTVAGLFHVDGGDVSKRVTLASSVSGSVWNLVLNGRYDVANVAVQDSIASGTVWLPINPVGFLDNGNNTNWYGAGTPRDLIFEDDFETSTLGSSPPDKTRSHWTMNNSNWFTGNSVVVNNQNHTTFGFQSMYSSGGSAGEGIGSWNSPSWGPVTNVIAECWFYDDMQSPKSQWVSVDDTTGYKWLAIVVKTSVSEDKYCYRGSMIDGVQVTYIDRRVGWHHARWIRDDNYTTLFLDDVQLAQVSNNDFPDFSSFDCGTFGWDNTYGSTGMWFDDFRVYRGQHLNRYRWYANDSAQSPTALAGENSSVTVNDGTILRLRAQVSNDEGRGVTGKRYALRYREGTNSLWRDLGSGEDWNYANGLGADKTLITNALLTGTNVNEYFVESLPAAVSVEIPAHQSGEWDFAIASTSKATIGSTYYFKVVETDSAGNYSGEMGPHSYLPTCELTSTSVSRWNGYFSDDWSNPYNWTPYGVPNSTSNVIIPNSAYRNCRVNIATAVCESLFLESGRSLDLTSSSTALTISKNTTIMGTLNHTSNSAVLTVSSGTLLIDGGAYSHSGSGALNATNATMRILNGGEYNCDTSGQANIGTMYVGANGLLMTDANDGQLNVGDFTIAAGGQFTNKRPNSRINVNGNFLNDGSMSGTTGGIFTFGASSGTIGGSSVTHIFYQMVVNGNYASTSTQNITVLDDLTINGSKTFTANSVSINIAGDWIDQGTFAHGSGTIVFNGTNAQSVTSNGSNWNNLIVSNNSSSGVTFADGFATVTFADTTPGSTLNFASGQTYVVSGVGGLTLTGSSGNLIKLRRSGGAAGSLWNIDPTGGSWNVSYVDVADSKNLAEQPISPANSTDSGNNINWFERDKDKDELADWWEVTYFGDLSHNAGEDADGDGLINFLEFVLLSDPTNANTNIVYVDHKGLYSGDGTKAKPFKYLDEAIAAATSGALILLDEGTYPVSSLKITKDMVIKGKSAENTFIVGPLPNNIDSDQGQVFQIATKRFALSDVTIRNFKAPRPLISYDSGTSSDMIVLQNLVVTGNTTNGKAMITPSGSQAGLYLYVVNCLAFGNTASAMIEAQGTPALIVNCTFQNNTSSNAVIVSGSGKATLANSILRGNGTEILNRGTGSLKIAYCNVEGGAEGAGNYDQAETFIDAAAGYYRPLTTSAAYQHGSTSFVVWDQDYKSRSDGVTVGAYEVPNDDYDADGLTNADETNRGTNVNHPDSDADGLSDYAEVNTYGTNPLNSDSDGDTVKDGQELPLRMNPAVSDGITRVGYYNESFEDTTKYPNLPEYGGCPWANTPWAAVDSAYGGKILIQDSADAYDGVRTAVGYGASSAAEGYNGFGNYCESFITQFVERNYLPEYWIYMALKIPHKRLPATKDEGICVAGAFFAVDENGFFCVYDPSVENWRVSSTIIAENEWTNICVHRNHAAKTTDLYVNGDTVFSGIPISGVDLENYIRISFTSVGEYAVEMDKLTGANESPY